MGKTTSIEWADHTFNPWEGCQKVGPGCDHCYAEARNARFGGGVAVNWGPGAERRRTSLANWRKPLQWNAKAFFQCKSCGHRGFMFDTTDNDGAPTMKCSGCASEALQEVRARVFCASLADVFDNSVDPAWRRDLFDLIELTPTLDWLLLTKRIGNVAEMVSRAKSHDWLAGQRNVWLGATVVNQEEADRDIPKLLAVPAAKRFLSMEPLLEAVNLRSDWLIPKYTSCQMGGKTREAMQDMVKAAARRMGETLIDWVIAGGESGPGARPMHPDWARSLRDQCAAAGVPFLFKQWGEWTSVWHARIDPELAVGKTYVHVTPMCRENGTNDSAPNYQLDRVGKKAAGRLLDGIEHNGFPS